MSVWPTPRIAKDAALNAVMRAAEKFGIAEAMPSMSLADQPVERFRVKRCHGDGRFLEVGFAASGRGDQDLLERTARLRRDQPGRKRGCTRENCGNPSGDRRSA